MINQSYVALYQASQTHCVNGRAGLLPVSSQWIVNIDFEIMIIKWSNCIMLPIKKKTT